MSDDPRKDESGEEIRYLFMQLQLATGADWFSCHIERSQHCSWRCYLVKVLYRDIPEKRIALMLHGR